MIFITLGSQKFQFNRLLKAMDELEIDEEIFAQIGYSDYLPKHYPYKAFLNRDEFEEMIKKSNIVITHGGTGAIMGAVRKHKKVIAIPRLAKYGEHVDDHQIQIINQFKELNLIYGLKDTAELASGLKFVQNHQFNSYISNTQAIIDSIESFIGD